MNRTTAPQKGQGVFSLIKQSVRIEAFAFGVLPKLKKSGKVFTSLCPFHTEKTPSFQIDPAKQTFHCFGCNAHGDIFDLANRLYHFDPTKLDGAKFIAEKMGIDLPQNKQIKTDPHLARLRKVLASASGFFDLEAHKKILDQFIKSRGLTKKTVKEFGIGIAPDEWHGQLEYLSKNGFTNQEMLDSGLIKKSERRGIETLYDTIRHRATFPILDKNNLLIGFSGRLLSPGHSRTKPKWINPPKTKLYDKKTVLYGYPQAKVAIQKSGWAILVEGYIDVQILHQAGRKETIGTCGTAFGVDHLKTLRDHNIKKCFLLFDGDPAGRNAALKTAKKIISSEIDCKICILPDGEDPDSYCRSAGKKGINQVLKDAVSDHQFISKYFADLVSNSPAGFQEQENIIIEALQICSAIPSEIKQSLFLTEIAKSLQIEKRILARRIGLDQNIPSESKKEGTVIEIDSFRKQKDKPDQNIWFTDQVVEEMNKHHAIIRINGRVFICTPNDRDYTLELDDVTFTPIKELHLQYMNRFVTVFENGKSKTETWSKNWLQSPDRAEFKGLVFDPSGAEQEQVLNLWKGFTTQPDENQDCSIYLNHIKEVICSGHEVLYEYILDWMADLVQNPTQKSGIALGLRGPQGTGKNTFAEIFGKLFGRHFVLLNKTEHMTRNFNLHLKDNLLTCLDEAFWPGDHSIFGTIKSMVTSSIRTIEKKGSDSIQLPDYSRYIVLTNNLHVAPVDPDDRRFFILEVSNCKVGQKEYFDSIYEQMKKGGSAKLLHLLLNRDLSNSDLRERPQTATMIDNKILSLDTVASWWYDVLKNKELYNSWEDKHTNNINIINKDLYQSYLDWHDNRKKRNNVWFAKELYSFVSAVQRNIRLKKEFDDFWAHGVILKPWQQLRNDFESYIKGTIDW